MGWKYLLQMVEKGPLSFSSVLYANLVRNPCNAVSAHEKDKGTPSPQAQPSM